MALVFDISNKRPRDNFRLRILESCLRLRVSVALEILQKSRRSTSLQIFGSGLFQRTALRITRAEMIGLVNTRISA